VLTLRRWELPLHLLDAIFLAVGSDSSQGDSKEQKQTEKHHRSASTVPLLQSGDAQSLLGKLRSALAEGFALRSLQRSPHLVLLSPPFYHEKLKPLLASWLALWMRNKHVAGISDDTMTAFLLQGYKGASPSSVRVSEPCVLSSCSHRGECRDRGQAVGRAQEAAEPGPLVAQILRSARAVQSRPSQLR
jgi:hypothetical protein